MARKKANYPLVEGLEITTLAAEGKAMGRWNDVVVFVPLTVPGDVVDVQIRNRRRRFMEVQAEISLRKLARRIGRIEDVIIDEEPDEDGVAVGRTKSDAPDIDGVCYVTTDRKLVPGDIVPVRITANEEHDLVGREVVA